MSSMSSKASQANAKMAAYGVRVVVADETGLVKRIALSDKPSILAKLGRQSRQNGVECMCWAGTNAEMPTAELASATKRGVVQVWDMLNQEVALSIEGAEAAKAASSNGGSIISMEALTAKEKLVTCSDAGLISIYPLVGGKPEETVTLDLKKPVSRMRLSPLYHSTQEPAEAGTEDSVAAGAGAAAEEAGTAAGGDGVGSSGTSSSSSSSSSSGGGGGGGLVSAGSAIVAVGGNEHDLRLHDLEHFSKGPIFKARNVPHNNLDMRVPVWVSDIQFLPGGSGAGHTLVTGTKHRQLRLYDVRAQPRPVMSMDDLFDHPVTSIACLPSDEGSVIVGDAAGTVQRVDLRRQLVMHRFKGYGGAVRELRVHPTRPIVAGVGLDRHLLVHHVDTRKLLHKVYLKQRLTGLLFDRDARRRRGGDGGEGDGGDDDDDDYDDDMDDDTWMGLNDEDDDDGNDDEGGGGEGAAAEKGSSGGSSASSASSSSASSSSSSSSSKKRPAGGGQGGGHSAKKRT